MIKEVIENDSNNVFYEFHRRIIVVLGLKIKSNAHLSIEDFESLKRKG